MTDVQDVYRLRPVIDLENDVVNIRPAGVQDLPQAGSVGHGGMPVRLAFQGENSGFQAVNQSLAARELLAFMAS